jgi:hypothetical protein
MGLGTAEINFGNGGFGKDMVLEGGGLLRKSGIIRRH